jgi:ClpP class serine protease
VGIYADYLTQGLADNHEKLTAERKKQLRRISEIRGRAILTFASSLTKEQAQIGIEYDDRIPFLDQINNIEGERLDVILETPGGAAEIVEDLVVNTRSRFSEIAMIIPGYAKSAGTIMVMAGDEILMEPSSALGPIDAQILQGGKRFSAHAFLEGIEKIKSEVEDTGQLNKAYIPILQNISPERN